MQRELDTHYSIAILPFLIMACLDSNSQRITFSKDILNRFYCLTIIFSTIAFLGYGRIAYFQTRYIPRYDEAVNFHRFKSAIPLTSSILTNDNYVAHFANREKVSTVERNILPVSEFDHIILPQISNQARIEGKLKLVKGSSLENHIYKTLREAKNAGMKCSNANPYVLHCHLK